MSERLTVNNVNQDLQEYKKVSDERFRRLEQDFAKLDKNMAIEFAVMKEKAETQHALSLEIKKAVDKLKYEPVDDYKKYKGVIATGVITAILSFILAYLGLK